MKDHFILIDVDSQARRASPRCECVRENVAFNEQQGGRAVLEES